MHKAPAPDPNEEKRRYGNDECTIVFSKTMTGKHIAKTTIHNKKISADGDSKIEARKNLEIKIKDAQDKIKRPAKVFVTHEVMRRHPTTGDYEPVHDVTSAAEYGHLEILISGRMPVDPQEIIKQVKRKLHDYQTGDVIVAIGDPIAIGIAMTVAALHNNGAVSVLKWDRQTERYIKSDCRFLT